MPAAKPKTRTDFKTDKEWWEHRQKVEEDIISKLFNTTNFEKAIEKLILEPERNVLTEPKEPVAVLKTNTLLDRMLGEFGGLEPGSTLELYGEYAASKTQICKTFVVESTGRVAYIDAEDTFRRKRLIQIAKARGKSDDYITNLNERLLLYKPKNWMEQYWLSKHLPEFDDEGNFLKVGLIILDSAMKLFADSEDFFGRDKMSRRQSLVRAQLFRLKRYAVRHGGVLVFTNQVYEDTSGLPPNVPLEMKFKGRGGKSMEHIPDYRILLIKKYGSTRVARLVDSLDQPLQEIPFMLSEKGIQDIKDRGELVKALEKSDSYGEKFDSGRVGSQPAAKKYADKYDEIAEELGLIDEDDIVEEGENEPVSDAGEDVQAI